MDSSASALRRRAATVLGNVETLLLLSPSTVNGSSCADHHTGLALPILPRFSSFVTGEPLRCPSDVLWPSFIMVLVSIPPTAFNGAADPVTPKRSADVPVGGQKAFWFEFLTHPFS